MKLSIFCIPFYAALAFASMAAHASTIYTCMINGTMVYTSRPGGACQTAHLPQIGRYSTLPYNTPTPATVAKPRAKAAEAQSKSTTAKKSALPVRNVNNKVAQSAPAFAPAMPKTNTSNGRRMILEQELANERRALGNTQQALNSARASKNQQMIQQYQSDLLDRQQNIQALQRELSRM